MGELLIMPADGRWDLRFKGLKVNVTTMLFYSAHKNTALEKLNSFQIHYSTVHNTEIVVAILHVTDLRYGDNVKNAENNGPTTAIYLYDLVFNPLNAELNPICCLLALLGAHHFLHVSRIRVKSLTFRLLMSYIYIYGAPILDVSRSHTTHHSR